MSYKLVLTEAARADLKVIFKHSLVHYPATHRQFRARFDEIVAELVDSPFSWAIWREPDIRRRLVTPYPFVVLFHIQDPQVIVEAVLHQRQDSSLRFPESP